MTTVHAPLPTNSRYQVLYRLSGQIITHWVHAEWALFMLFGFLARCDLNRARIILAAHQSFRAKRELIERLGNAYLPIGALPQFDVLMGRVKHLSEKRNMVAHHRAYYMEEERVWRFMNDSDETQPDTFGRYQDVQTGNLRTWVKEISHLNNDILGFFTKDAHRQLRDQPRGFVELEADRQTLAALRQGQSAKP
jgi:hypothetical protein